MLALELVEDKESKDPLNAKLFGNIWEKTKNYGLLVGKGGGYGNCFRIQVPVCITHEDIDFAIDVMDRSIRESLEE